MRLFMSLGLGLMLFLPYGFTARPLSTDDSPVVEPGHLEVELGFEFVEDTDKEYNGSLVSVYGLLDNWDMGFEVPYQYIDIHDVDDKVSGLGDIVVFSKYRLFEQTQNLPSLALSVNVKTKSGREDKGLGTSMLDYGLNVILTKETDKCIVHLNLGYTYSGISQSRKYEDIFSYSLAAEYPLSDKLNLVGEFGGETNFKGDFKCNFTGV